MKISSQNLCFGRVACTYFPEAHTSSNIAQELFNVIYEWDLNGKVALIVSDNVNNVNAITKDLKMKYLGCTAHKINLILSEGLEVKHLIEKVKNIVNNFKRSTKATNVLREEQLLKNLQPKKLINVNQRSENLVELYILYVEKFCEFGDMQREVEAISSAAIQETAPTEETGGLLVWSISKTAAKQHNAAINQTARVTSELQRYMDLPLWPKTSDLMS